ncbi:alpha-amylase [Lachnospiraceae bacterium KM106-2]|nr:alpha-amylase [Lachnospiraceae bacterium KM106-2]
MKKSILKLVLLVLCITFLTACGNKKDSNEKLNIIDDNNRTYYEVFLYSFCDSNKDGIGDINGLISKLDYISDLGCNGIWLMPIMPSDSYHKYDVNDYYSVDPSYGTKKDFKKLVAECNKRGIKLIIDMVFNHTSNKQEWFVKATDYLKQLPAGKKPDEKECKYIKYYNFAKDMQDKSTYYQVKGTDWYYQGVFAENMPDLNLDDQNVKKEIQKVADYWLDLGIGGFRLDASKEYFSGNPEKNIEVLKWFSRYVQRKSNKIYVVAEVWDEFTTISDYYTSGIDSIFNYTLGGVDGIIPETVRMAGNGSAGKTFAENLKTIQSTFQESNKNYIDAPFISNHDNDRPVSYVSYDKDKVKFMGGINLMMNGSSFIYYGEEIGMSGNGKDENKRAPMRWTKEKTDETTDGPIGMEKQKNKFGSVEEQEKDDTSIWNYYKHAIRLRNENPEIARGTINVMNDITDGDIVAITKTYKKSKIGMLMNNSSKEKKLTLNKEKYGFSRIKGSLTVNDKEPELEEKKITLPPYSIVILK